MNKDIFLGVIPVDESVSRLDVEPFHRAAHLVNYKMRIGFKRINIFESHLGGDHLLYRLFLLLHLQNKKLINLELLNVMVQLNKISKCDAKTVALYKCQNSPLFIE